MMERITPTEFARREQVNRKTVYRWIAAGRITQGPDGLIDAAQGKRERQATESTEPRHQARKAQFDEIKAAQGVVAGESVPDMGPGFALPVGAVEKLGLMHKQAALKRLMAQTELAHLELDQASKLLYLRADVDFILTDFGAHLAEKLNSLADRYASELVACQGDAAKVHKTLEDAAHQILEELNAHLLQRLEELDA